MSEFAELHMIDSFLAHAFCVLLCDWLLALHTMQRRAGPIFFIGVACDCITAEYDFAWLCVQAGSNSTKSRHFAAVALPVKHACSGSPKRLN